MRIVLAGLGQDNELAYERFVGAHPAALIYSSLRYRDFLCALTGGEARYALALQNQEIVGVLPLIALDGPFGTVMNSLPYFGSNGGVLAADAAAQAVLLDWYAGQARSSDVCAATMIANPLLDDGGGRPARDLADSRIGHVTPLDGLDGEEGILSMIDGAARRNVRKATREGVEVAIENTALDVLQSVHREAMGAIGGAVKDSSFFALVQEHFRAGTDYDVFIARVRGRPAAGLLVFYFGSCVDYYVPAVAPAERSLQPMAALLLAAMSEALQRGFTRWNWGGSWSGQVTLQRFKAKWGGLPREYEYSTIINEPALLRLAAADLLRAYPNFYVVPFSALQSSD